MVGHGARGLVVWGPPALGAPATFTDVLARRFRCLTCRAVFLVVPADVATTCYSSPAIHLALALWTLRLMSAATVRAQISPLKRQGPDDTGWPSLYRWARLHGVGDGTLRERAARYVQQRLARSPLSANNHGIEPRIWAASLQQA